MDTVSSNNADLDNYELELPDGWRRVDRWIIRVTKWIAFLVGITFSVLVMLEVISRYLFNFSIYQVNAAATFLLVWFFMLGAGLALRQRAHVGVAMLLNLLPAVWARAAFLLAQALIFFYFVALAWAGYRALGPSTRQIEGSLEISYLWVMISIPVGFLLLLYNQVAMFVSGLRKPRPGATKS